MTSVSSVSVVTKYMPRCGSLVGQAMFVTWSKIDVPITSVSRRGNAVVTCEINYFKIISALSFRRRPSEIILLRHMETCLKLFENFLKDCCSSWIFCSMFNVAEIILKQFWNSFSGWTNFISVSDVITSEIKKWNNFAIISVFYFTCNHRWWLHVN